MKASLLVSLILAAAVSMAAAQDKSRKPAAATSAKSAEQGGADEPGQALASFFTLLAGNRIDEAYAGLMKGSKIVEEVKTFKAKTIEAITSFGPISGYEQIETTNAGANLTRRTCVSLHRDFPLRWRFYFYRAGGVWRLVDIRVDDNLSGIFGEPEGAVVPEAKRP